MSSPLADLDELILRCRDEKSKAYELGPLLQKLRARGAVPLDEFEALLNAHGLAGC